MSNVKKKTDDVFGITRDIPLNYVARRAVDEKFIENLTREKHLVVHGSSKQGKTTLRKHCLNESDYIVATCSNRWSIRDLNAAILKAAGFEITQSTSRTQSGDAKVKASIHVGIAALESGLGAGASTTNTRKPLELDLGDVNDVITALNSAEFDRYIVLEDFHYLPIETQKDFAVSLKAFHENSNFCFIIVGVWLDENRLTVYNGDLSGRVVSINADNWTDVELREVISRGEELLGVTFDPEFVNGLISNCEGSVAILQEASNQACKNANVFETRGKNETIAAGVDAKELVKEVVSQQGGRYTSFLIQFAEGFQQTELEMYRWLLFAVLTTPVEILKDGLRQAEIRHSINSSHPQSPLNPGNITQALQSVAKLQVTKEIKPIILDYDETNLRLKVVDRGFLIWLAHQDVPSLLTTLGLPGQGVSSAAHQGAMNVD